VIIYGLDPSFSGFGVCAIDTENKDVFHFLYKGGVGIRSWDQCISSAWEVTDKFINQHKRYLPISQIGIEVPPPIGSSSAGLWALSSRIVSAFSEIKIKQIYTFGPMYVSHILGKRHYRNGELSALGVNLLSLYNKAGYKIHDNLIRGSINNNKASATVFASRLFVRLAQDADHTLIDGLKQFNLFSQKEVLFKIP